MQDDDFLIRAQSRERRLELQRLVDGFVYELLDDRLAPRPEGAASEAAGKPFHTRKPDALHFAGAAIQDADPMVDENLLDITLVARFEIVIAEHGDDRDPDRCRQILHEVTSFIGSPVVGDVSGKHEDVCPCRDLRQQRLQRTRGRLADMQIGCGGDSHPASQSNIRASWHPSCLCRGVTPTTVQAPSRHATEFYKRVINVFQDNGVEFLVGGAYAFVHYTGIGRDTKDLDLFIRRVDWDRAARALEDVGISAELTFPHWLGKALGGRQREFFVDLIFSGGNGVAEVDDEWFANAQWDESLGFPVRLMPIEEMIWSKAFVMERERFDGADVLHLVRARQMDINWPRLGHPIRRALARPAVAPRAVPICVSERSRTARGHRRAARSRQAEPKADDGIRLCRGPLLSREQYLIDVERWNYFDAREVPVGTMTPEEISLWTQAIDKK